MRAVVLSLMLAACGGSPFTSGILDGAETSVPDGDSHDSGGAESDGAVGDAMKDTSPIESGSESDAPSEAPGSDAQPDSPMCVLGAPFGCNGSAASYERVTPPSQFCVCSDGSCSGPFESVTTPAACATCDAYTCDCIKTNAALNVKSCTEQNGQITVILQ